MQNEQIIGTEIGYGFRSSFLSANVNLYRTSWADRFESVSAVFNAETPEEIRGNANLYGITQVHTGLEIDANAKVTDKLTLTGMFSLGNWEYKDNVEASFFDNNQNPIPDENGNPEVATLLLDGVKVGDAPQLTASLGARYEILNNLTVDGNYRFVDKLYAAFDATAASSADFAVLELPSFGLVDAGASYRLNLGNSSVNFRVNMNNVFDTMYISESDTNILASPGDATYDGINVDNRVYFGFGRTWNAGLTYNF